MASLAKTVELRTALLEIMRPAALGVAILLTVVPIPHPPQSFAQQVRMQGKRKVLKQVNAVYPSLARKINLTGIVKLVAIVAPDGSVVRTEVVGGSPVLVQSAVDAISKSKWQAGPQETKELIEVQFEPDAD
jgi:outer membrane biosynthesis protein TonB